MSTTAAIPVFDAAKLKQATNGDPSLQKEVLTLFVAEVQRLMRQVEDATAPEVRAERLRALVATARNTGATLVANEARALETQIAAESPDISPLTRAVAETLAFVRKAGI